MKNVTITLDEELARWARIMATGKLSYQVLQEFGSLRVTNPFHMEPTSLKS
jgi:hypothetical protein